MPQFRPLYRLLFLRRNDAGKTRMLLHQKSMIHIQHRFTRRPATKQLCSRGINLRSPRTPRRWRWLHLKRRIVGLTKRKISLPRWQCKTAARFKSHQGSFWARDHGQNCRRALMSLKSKVATMGETMCPHRQGGSPRARSSPLHPKSLLESRPSSPYPKMASTNAPEKKLLSGSEALAPQSSLQGPHQQCN